MKNVNYNVTSILDEQLNFIQIEKNKILEKKLTELDLLEELKKDPERRFKKFVQEVHPDGLEKFWFNDGTEQGRLIITFKVSFSEGAMNIKYD